MELSGLLDKLEVGDELMPDKGFLIQDLLTPIGVHLYIPPFLDSRAQIPTDNVLLTKKICSPIMGACRESNWMHQRILHFTQYSSCSHMGLQK